MATKGYNLEQTGEQVQAALNRIINLSTATEETDGLMSSSDKSSLENLNTEINNKVDKVSGKGLSTNDFTNEEKAKVDSAYQAPSSGIPKADLSSEVQASLTNADNAVQGLSEVNAKIPAQATSQNQLADKAFVNSSVATASADFKGTYDTLQELQAVTADKNDYGYVVSTDSAGNTIYSRYKYTGSAWVFEYDLNNSSFTASEWAAIQSGITSAGVQKLNALPTNSELNTALAGKQATLVSGTNIKTVGGQSLVGSGNVPMNDPDAVKYTAQTPTDAQKTQARTNIGAYAKPSGGIPKTDLASGVQGSLDLADSAIQARPSGEVDPTITPAEYATQEELAQLEAEVSDLDGELNGRTGLNPANLLTDPTFALGMWELQNGTAVYSDVSGSLSKKATVTRINTGASAYLWLRLPVSLFEDGKTYRISIISGINTQKVAVRTDNGSAFQGFIVADASMNCTSRGDGTYLCTYDWLVDSSSFGAYPYVQIAFKFYDGFYFEEPFVGLSTGVTTYSITEAAVVLKKTDVVDALNSTATDAPLSAKQGKVLKDDIDNLDGAIESINEEDVAARTDIKYLNPANALTDPTFGLGVWEVQNGTASYSDIPGSLSKKANVVPNTQGSTAYFFQRIPLSLLEDGKTYRISIVCDGVPRVAVRSDNGSSFVGFIVSDASMTSSSIGGGLSFCYYDWLVNKSAFGAYQYVQFAFKIYYTQNFYEPFVGLLSGDTNYEIEGKKAYARIGKTISDDRIYPDVVKVGSSLKLEQDFRLTPIRAVTYEGDYIELDWIERDTTYLNNLMQNNQYGLVVSSQPSLLYKDINGVVTTITDVNEICAKTYLFAGTYYRIFRDAGEGGYNEWFFVEYRNNKTYNALEIASTPRMDSVPDYSAETWDWSKDSNNRYTIMQQVYDYMDGLLNDYPMFVEKYDPMAASDYTEGGITIHAMPNILSYMTAHGFSSYPFWYDGCAAGTYTITTGGHTYTATMKATPAFRPFVYKISRGSLWGTTRSNSHNIARRILYVQGGVHGQENMGPVSVAHLMKELLGNSMGAYSILANYDVYLFPVLDGYCSLHGDYNGAYGTNANRNYPTPWWRAESADWGQAAGDYFVARLACAFIDTLKPDVAFDVHDQTGTVADLGYFSSGFQYTGHNFYQFFAESANVLRNTARFEQYFGTKGQIPPFRNLTERMVAAHAHDYFFTKGIRSGGLLELPGGINWVEQSDGSCISQRVSANDYGTNAIELAALLLINYVFGACEYDLKIK